MSGTTTPIAFVLELASPRPRRNRADVSNILPLADSQLKELSGPPGDAARSTREQLGRFKEPNARTGKSTQLSARGGFAASLRGARPQSQQSRPEAGLGLRPKRAAPNPTHRELSKGWNSLLDEIAESDRRVRVVKGSEGASVQLQRLPTTRFEQGSATLSTDTELLLQPGMRTCSHSGAADAESLVWASYSIDDQVVPDAALADMWRRASDPKCRGSDLEMAPLERVPRLTVTKHEMQKFPVVHSLDHWRTESRARRQQRKDRKKEPPTLQEMMRNIFGCEAPPKARTRKFVLDKFGPPEKTPEPPPLEERSGSRPLSVESMPSQADEQEMEEELRKQWAKEAHMDSEIAASEYGKPYMGARGKGRRFAVDHGQPLAPNRGLVEMKMIEEGHTRKSRLRRRLDKARAASGSEHERLLDEACAASFEVDLRCKRRLRRAHDLFVRKQNQLSTQLQGRVKRLQLDYEDVQTMRSTSILRDRLPQSTETTSMSKSGSKLSGTEHNLKGVLDVLQYLRRHRRLAERRRRSLHEVYLQQVEQFQSFLRLMADPNRPPDRAELYLSECFRHVLSAGFIVDDNYFFRVLGYLEREDFEKTPTVNLLAACCAAFDVDLTGYWQLLDEKGVPMFAPSACPEKVKKWDDWAPWNGVELKNLELDPDLLASLNTAFAFDSVDDLPSLVRDPLPFCPIVPQETPASSQVSRSDPLSRMLDMMALDSVLDSYPQLRRKSPDNDLLRGALGAVRAGGLDAAASSAASGSDSDSEKGEFGSPAPAAGRLGAVSGSPRGTGTRNTASPLQLPWNKGGQALQPAPPATARSSLPPLPRPRPNGQAPVSARLPRRISLSSTAKGLSTLSLASNTSMRRAAALAAEAALMPQRSPQTLTGAVPPAQLREELV